MATNVLVNTYAPIDISTMSMSMSISIYSPGDFHLGKGLRHITRT